MCILITHYTRPSQQKNNGQCNRRPHSVQQAWAKCHQHKYTSTQNHNHLVVHIRYVLAVSCDYWFRHVLQSYTPPPPPPLVFCFTHSFLPYNTYSILMPIPPPSTPNLPSILLPKQQQEQKRPSCFMATALSSFSVTRTSWKTANQYNCQHLRNLKNAHNIVHARITSVHTEWDTRPKTPGKTTDSSSQTGKSSSGKPRLWSSGTIRLNGQPNTPLHLMTHSSHLMTSPTHPSDNPPLHLMTSPTHRSIWCPYRQPNTPLQLMTSPNTPLQLMTSPTHPSIWIPIPPSDDQMDSPTHPSDDPPLHLMTHPSIWWPDGQPNTPLHLMTSPTRPSIWWPAQHTPPPDNQMQHMQRHQQISLTTDWRLPSPCPPVLPWSSRHKPQSMFCRFCPLYKEAWAQLWPEGTTLAEQLRGCK